MSGVCLLGLGEGVLGGVVLVVDGFANFHKGVDGQDLLLAEMFHLIFYGLALFIISSFHGFWSCSLLFGISDEVAFILCSYI